MNLKWTRRFRVPRSNAPAAMDEHHAIRSIGQLLVICISVLVLTAASMVGIGLQVRLTYEKFASDSARARAANAIDLIVAQSGPLTPSSAELIGRLASLPDAHLTTVAPTDSGTEKIPLLGNQGARGSYLVWTADPFAADMFQRIAPIRLPIIGGMLFLVATLLLRLRLLVRDIERQRLWAHALSRTDVVTGLANRLAFETAMGELSAAAIPFGIVILDLDRFKAVNDAFGHAAGDTVLRTVGQRLTRLLGPNDRLARLGGDEFVILCVSMPHHAGLTVLAQQCIYAIEQPIELAGRAVVVGTSLGLVEGNNGDLPPETLLGAADAALYRAKSITGSSFQFAGDNEPNPETWQLRCA